MLDFFAIFSKGGIVLWCFQGAGVSESFAGPVNALIRSVILQERTGNSSFTHNALSLKYKLDNEFELVFVVGFQKILTLTYVDKFIDDVQLHFRDRYKNELGQKGALKFLVNHFEFEDDFSRLLRHFYCFIVDSKSPKPQKPKKKENRVWEMGGTSSKDLDYSETNSNGSYSSQGQDNEAPAEPVRRKGFGGMFGMLKGLVGSKTLTQQDMEPILEKMKDHLIAKNVAADIASQLCDSVAKKLEGKVMGTFTTVASTVKQALQESLVQILQPKRRVDILRDVLEARAQRKPFVITFCGVNGVGKSTNLAKISYWLIENGFTVLIAACDTFRAGAVEQLRTHQRRLNSLHPPEQHGGHPVVQLFEKGYGKDAAGIAMEAIAYARNQCFDVVLVDTAGRMQDNAPLMTALAKLIAVNTPDLVLFVGEALVGNEAVDQLVKFNQALADHSMSDHPRLIDGIVLTKFDTIDDKVGAAISMTYITGQPIVFVGTGQTYSDLRSLNARAVVNALMKA
uniref:SRP54-type proteins GTP-binding domain-containing protein n=1 Tax=Pygocentrus nattereri TaxID=42514 RepID=A0AAR2KEJ6_PYGNA